MVDRSQKSIATVGQLSRSLNRPTKSHLNAAKNLFKYLNSTKDYSICFSYNGNIVADLGPKLSNSSNTTTKLSRDFHSKEGPRPLTTTSTTIVDSRNSKGSSRTSIINSSLVPIGFSNSDFAGDKATSKFTYSYLYKLAGRPISWKTKRATTIALSTLEAETHGLTEAIREVQWIIGLFSELYRPIDHPITLYGDNRGSITVANDPALHARTKHTLLKFQYVREQVKAKKVTIIYLNTKCERCQMRDPDSLAYMSNFFKIDPLQQNNPVCHWINTILAFLHGHRAPLAFGGKPWLFCHSSFLRLQEWNDPARDTETGEIRQDGKTVREVIPEHKTSGRRQHYRAYWVEEIKQYYVLRPSFAASCFPTSMILSLDREQAMWNPETYVCYSLAVWLGRKHPGTTFATGYPELERS
ncbi:hypothetical protein P8C59_004373 [Phyllachora maydis]|uniref:Uncharacterized protein n=1 Tax=Phyllachora maydis TaxID=1825666 RepID=A0AAD9MEB7_9PEZI|nr:hypothetical protein P8C59_004373 [Phyllachora maydis]